MANEKRHVILYHENSGTYADQYGKVVSPFPIDQKREHTSKEIELVPADDMNRVRDSVRQLLREVPLNNRQVCEELAGLLGVEVDDA